MKKDFKLNRRQLLDLGAKLMLSLPAASVIGSAQATLKPPSPENSLKKLILLLGPWSAADTQKAEDFASRFLKAEHAVEPYLPASGKLLQSLASRFPDEAMAVCKIDLQSLPTEERELLVTLTKQLYGFIEVRFAAADAPPWGQCQGDRLLHTRTP